MTQLLEEYGNPFKEDSKELFTLDTKVIMPENVIQMMRGAEELGQSQYETFASEHLDQTTDKFYETIHRNNIKIFKSAPHKPQSKARGKISCLQADRELFSRLYISCQSHEGDLEDFFSHENQPWPPALADCNQMRQTNKSELLAVLEKVAPRLADTPNTDTKIIDGAALVHLLDPKKSWQPIVVKTYQHYADKVFLPYLQRELQSCQRLDVVWDIYTDNSLKAYTRQCRGSGDALKVEGTTSLPGNWGNFLRVNSNKTGLFTFLANEIAAAENLKHKLVITTRGEEVLSNRETDVDGLQPCSHEESDTRMMLQTSHAYTQEYRNIMIIATDTDVVVLAIFTASKLPDCKLFLEFGHGKDFRYISFMKLLLH